MIYLKYPYVWKLKNTLLDNSWIKKKITMGIKTRTKWYISKYGIWQSDCMSDFYRLKSSFLQEEKLTIGKV